MIPKITVYIPCHDYGRYLAKAIDSVLAQSSQSWELLIMDDGSSDETVEVANSYVARDPDRIYLHSNSQKKGLRNCANLALQKAKAKYFMRLDADDYLDENALLVLCHYLDTHPDIGLVFPNFILVDEQGRYLGVEDRKIIGSEAKLLDLPAHGACTVVRREILETIGGYSEEYDAQDGHELWLKFLDVTRVANIATPLFFYRQHDASMTRNETRILRARATIKDDMALKKTSRDELCIVAVIPVKNTYTKFPNIALKEFASRPLVDYALTAAQEAKLFQKIFVTTDDEAIVRHCSSFEEVTVFKRPLELSAPQARLSEVLHHAVLKMEKECGVHPDVLVLLNVGTPLCSAHYIREAVNTLLLYQADSVISVYEDRDILFSHTEYGLEPINKGMLKNLRLEREALYVDNGAIRCLWRSTLSPQDFYGQKIGHVVMPFEESFQLKTPFDSWLISQALERKKMAEVI